MISIKSSSWLPAFYHTCDVLLASMGEDLEYLLGANEARIAKAMVRAANDESAKAIAKSVHAHKVVWDGKDESERTKISSQASVWATRHNGHRVTCPACKNDALVFGVAVSAPIKTINGDEITERQEFIPTRFECVACGLKMSGLAHLNACSLSDTYTATLVYDASEYYAQQDPLEGYEPDFNEP